MPPLCPPPQTPSANASHGFTLVELLTVIAIVGILAAILVPVVGRIRESARTSNCVSHLKGTGAAFQLYAADNKGLYPALRFQTKNKGVTGTNPTEDNWQVELSPYQSRTVNDLGKLNAGSDSYVFCPEFVARYESDPRWKSTISTTAGYGMNANLGTGANVWDLRFKAALIPQPARTILVGDSAAYYLNVSGSWSPSTANLGGYSSGDPVRHAGKAGYLYADGHVATLDPDTALTSLTAP
ncbi:MAG: type secretory pathway, pseudopilin PulG [Rariglobus sp.]|jgi:general secretion pathway protein G|nr:type secretory pathway, pseudopilin PulG [Rariglobus sp.]